MLSATSTVLNAHEILSKKLEDVCLASCLAMRTQLPAPLQTRLAAAKEPFCRIRD